MRGVLGFGSDGFERDAGQLQMVETTVQEKHAAVRGRPSRKPSPPRELEDLFAVVDASLSAWERAAGKVQQVLKHRLRDVDGADGNEGGDLDLPPRESPADALRNDDARSESAIPAPVRHSGDGGATVEVAPIAEPPKAAEVAEAAATDVVEERAADPGASHGEAELPPETDVLSGVDDDTAKKIRLLKRMGNQDKSDEELLALVRASTEAAEEEGGKKSKRKWFSR